LKARKDEGAKSRYGKMSLDREAGWAQD